jgi:hypothetical protein
MFFYFSVESTALRRSGHKVGAFQEAPFKSTS